MEKTVKTRHPHIATLNEFCEITKVKKSLAYELSRHNAIPGMFRIGRQVRVNIDEFFAAISGVTQ